MMNIGTRPTVDGTLRTVEIHFFDFSNDIYGQEITISLLKRMRDEQKFESLDALKEQLKIDQNNAMMYLKSHE